MRSITLISTVGLLALACDGAGDGGTGDGGTDDTDAVYADGCIDVSGADQGFEFVADAVKVAQDGATIELCNDLTEAIVVDKTLTILGNGVVLTPPPNDMAVVVKDGGSLTISDVDIQTTRSGMVVESGGALTASNIDIVEVANYGFDIASGATATITDAVVTAPDWGGFRVVGGTLNLTNADVTDAGSFGLFADSSANVVLRDSRFGGIVQRDSSTQLWDIDGVGVWIEGGSTVEMSGNTIIAAEIAGVSVDGNSNVTMDGDQIISGGVTFAGLTVRSSTFEASNIEATDYRQYGMITIDATDVTLNSVSFTTDPELSLPNDLANNRTGSTGVYGIESELTITGTEEVPSLFAGNNGAGVLVSPRQGGSVSGLTMSNALVQDNAAFGVVLYSGDAVITDVTISGTRNDDEYCITETGYRCNMALALWTSSATLVNTSVLDSADWGATVVNGVMDVEGGVYARNKQNSLFGQGGSITAKDVLFEQGGDDHISMQQNGTVVVDGCTFRDGEYVRETISDSGDQVVEQISHYQARDIYASATDLTVLNSTFENGEWGITIAGGGSDTNTATIQDSTFTGYNQYAIYGTSGVELDVTNVSVTDIGQYALYCFDCDLQVTDFNVSNVTKFKYKFEYYIDGEEIFISEYERAGPAIYLSNVDASFENVTVDGVDSRAFYANNATLEMDGVTFKDVVRDDTQPSAVEIIWSPRTIDGSVAPTSYPNSVLNDVTIQGPLGNVPEGGSPVIVDAIRFTGWTDSATNEQADGVVEIIDLLITEGADRDILGRGMLVNNLGSFNVTGFDIDGTRGTGLEMNEVSGSIIGASGARTGTINAPGAVGIDIDAARRVGGTSSVTLEKVTVLNSVEDGITVNQGTHSFSEVTVTAAGGWGATCTDVTFDVCDASLDGALGETDGCDACVVVE